MSNDFSIILQSVAKESLERKFAAAKESHYTGPISSEPTTINQELDDSIEGLVARTSQLIRDYPRFAAAVKAHTAFVVGKGHVLQYRPIGRDGKIDKKLALEVETKFKRWATNPKSCSSNGKMSFAQLQKIRNRQRLQYGEAFFIMNKERDGVFHLMPINPLRIKDESNMIHTEGKWRGINYDPMTGAVKSYTIFDSPEFSLDNFRSVNVPAERIIHSFHCEEAGQLRGATQFSSVILLAYMQQDYMQAELAAQQLSARYMAFITQAPGSSDAPKLGRATYDQALDKYKKAISYCQVNLLKPGETVTMNTQQRSTSGIVEFTRLIDYAISSVLSMPAELITGNYEGLDFTTLRGSRNDFKQFLELEWEEASTQFNSPVFLNWLDWQVLNGKIKIPDYRIRKEDYQNHEWIVPAIANIDPLKEVKADILKVRAGFTSPQRIVESYGSDFDLIMDEIKEYSALVRDAELVFPELSANAKTLNFDENEEEATANATPSKKDSDGGEE
jgi:lambda family phage portal protein